MPAESKPTNAWIPDGSDANSEQTSPASTDTTEETPVAAAKGSKGTNQTDTTDGTSTAPEEAQTGSAEDTVPQGSGSTDSGNSSEPIVVNDDNGQHVEMPDGSTVQTRSHPYPVSNSEWQKYEITHSGDQNRYSYVPGDKEYSAYSDPHVPNSSMARSIETEIASYAERVLKDPNAEVSRIWNALKAGYDKALELAIDGVQELGKVRA